MNNIINIQKDISTTEERVINLYEICKLMEIRHTNGKRMAEEIQEKDGFGTVLKISIVYNDKGQTTETYSYTKKQAIMIGARLDSANIITLVNKLDELTQKPHIDSYMIDDPVDRAKAWIIEAEERKALMIENKTKSLKIAEDAPKVQFATNISKAVNSINIGSYAKALSEEYGVKIGQNRLFSFLRDSGILIKSGRRKNDPVQKYIDNNYFIVKESEVITNYGIRAVTTTLITGKGQLGLSVKILNHFKKPIDLNVSKLVKGK